MKKHLEHLEDRHGKVVLAEERQRVTCTLSEAVQRMFPDVSEHVHINARYSFSCIIKNSIIYRYILIFSGNLKF